MAGIGLDPMGTFLNQFKGLPEISLGTGEIVITEGERSGKLFVMIEGDVEVLKEGVEINTIVTEGSIFGEVSVLLDIPHMATVKAASPSRFYVVDDALAFLQGHPEINLHLAALLARRLNSVTRYLVDLKNQFKESEGHLGMVGEVLDGLQHQQYEESEDDSSR